jgi:putative CocE/NonD family hydrolase
MEQVSTPSLWSGLEVPLRDGTVLRGFRYDADGGPGPVILAMTPYGADQFHPRALEFTRRGFVCVALDLRGCGDSDGSFVPFETDGRDGYDTVEWLAGQDWCNGKVVMWGGSYDGFVQWAVAAEAPPHLAAIAPVAAVCPGIDFPMQRNIWSPFIVRWLSLTTIGRRVNQTLFGDEQYWRDIALQHVQRGAAYRTLDRTAAGQKIPVFQEWLDHPEIDDYWDARVPSESQYANIQIPVLTITGHYDDDQVGALHYYRHHLGSSSARDRHLLLIGPWDHSGTRTPRSSFGGLTFADQSVIDLVDLHSQWYDWVLDRGPRPTFLAEPVTYYEAGTEQWRSAGSIDELDTEPLRLYLNSDGRPADALDRSGLLSDSLSATPSVASMLSDPDSASLPGRDEPAPDSPYAGAQSLEQIDGDGLIYLTTPLRTDLQITGRCKLICQLEADVPDFDLEARLYLLTEDSAILLASDWVRARYASSLRQAAKWPIGSIEQIEWSTFPWFSRRVAAGHRLAVVIRPPDRAQELNRQSGEGVADETAHDTRKGTIRLHQSAVAQSYLELPKQRAH